MWPPFFVGVPFTYKREADPIPPRATIRQQMTYDLIIIGAGPGGYETAVEAAREGLNVAVVEKGHPGGTCLNVGCIPTKCLCRNAEVLEDVKNAERYGISCSPVAFDLAKAVARKDEVVEKLRAGIGSLMQQPGITLWQGEARFAPSSEPGVHVIKVSEAELRAPKVILALGSTTKFLPVEGAHSEGVVTSTEMLSLTEVPRRLCIIGGGVIGLEFASIFRSFGAEVCVVEYCKEVLPAFDKDIAKRLRTSLKKRGIAFKTGAAVTAIRETPEGAKLVEYDEKGKIASTEADLVLMAVGRVANVEAMNLSEAGIAVGRRGIEVDEHLQTNVPGVYAVGDVNGLLQLAHAATFQGKVALAHLLGRDSGIRLDICPAAVFTVPELAMVGQTEEQLTQAGTPYEVHKAFYRANGKALAMEADDGMMKVLTAPDGKILGAHILGAHAADLIHEAAVVMSLGGTLRRLQDTVHAHPTLSEILLSL